MATDDDTATLATGPAPALGDLVVQHLAAGAGDDVFGGFNDLVLVVGPELDVEYANPVCAPVLGWDPLDLVGRRVTDLLHPDDRERALHAEQRTGTDAAARAVGATYRVQHVDGSWRSLELNVGHLGTGRHRRAVVTGRIANDHAIQSRIVEMLTAGVPIDEVVRLIPSFGIWRFPQVPFAVALDGPHLARQVVGGPAAADLLRALVAHEPWHRAPVEGAPVRGKVSALEAPGRELATGYGMTDWVAIGVRAGDGETGAFVTGWTNPMGPAIASVEDSARLMARALGLILEWHRQRIALVAAADHDPLTGVPNRRSAFASLRRALARAGDEPVAVCYLDLDGFKAVNDDLGHAAGDAVLVEVAHRLRDLLRPGDVLGRIGGDELVVVCTGLDARGAAEHLARRAIAEVSRPVAVAGGIARVGVSIGIAVTDPHADADVDPDDLLARADGALYVAKGAGGGRSVTTSGPGGLDSRELRRRP